MANTIPSTVYDSLLLKLVTVLELTQKPDGISTPQAKQAVLQATNEFKTLLVTAKNLADNLPGGDLDIVDQDNVIEMLTTLRDRKRDQLVEFSSKSSQVASAVGTHMFTDAGMEIDSMASTPMT
ncbi:hypothetical protein LENED_004440 [Lentinula edodes]|uniref:Mediator complex subunit 9 n=1 Tax=Lentinula edodes TaxID=5353 RepID=A0A1Q3E687_LENED|nr:hypothetical protein F5877DRAFT_76165 [Lentinula edodes]GAW02772.1 hypothetical protein LENED_004440 [Lentinula edodes]